MCVYVQVCMYAFVCVCIKCTASERHDSLLGMYACFDVCMYMECMCTDLLCVCVCTHTLIQEWDDLVGDHISDYAEK